MRALKIGLFAAATLALMSPASAEDLYVGVPGAGVEVARDPGYLRDFYRDRGYRRTEGFAPSDIQRCRTTVIRNFDGTVTKERRCRD
jgi:hypothetical protein